MKQDSFYEGKRSTITEPVSEYAMQEKINELVDAVNDLCVRVPVVESRVSILEENAHPTAKVEPKENIYTKTCRMDKEFAEEELDRTRKALDVAVNALKEIHLPKQWCPVFAEQEIAKKALDQITALEQKDK